MRTLSVLSPRSTSQLSKGASTPPVVLARSRIRSPFSHAAQQTKPEIVSLCPLKNLLPLCTTMSAPNSSGFCR